MEGCLRFSQEGSHCVLETDSGVWEFSVFGDAAVLSSPTHKLTQCFEIPAGINKDIHSLLIFLSIPKNHLYAAKMHKTNTVDKNHVKAQIAASKLSHIEKSTLEVILESCNCGPIKMRNKFLKIADTLSASSYKIVNKWVFETISDKMMECFTGLRIMRENLELTHPL